MLALAGCTAWVQSVTLSDSADYLWLITTSSAPRESFSTADARVTVAVAFTPNFFAAFKSFRIDWIDPDNHFHERHYTKTEWGSHQYLVETMDLAGTSAAEHPGRWRVEIWHKDQLLVRRWFEVVPAARDAPPAPPVDFT